jgi:hypothetical protein
MMRYHPLYANGVRRIREVLCPQVMPMKVIIYGRNVCIHDLNKKMMQQPGHKK